jgi:hypothetical protein
MPRHPSSFSVLSGLFKVPSFPKAYLNQPRGQIYSHIYIMSLVVPQSLKQGTKETS